MPQVWGVDVRGRNLRFCTEHLKAQAAKDERKPLTDCSLGGNVVTIKMLPKVCCNSDEMNYHQLMNKQSKHMKITARTHKDFMVETGDFTADGREIVGLCFLEGNVLRNVYKVGEILTVPPIRVALGPVSFAKVTTLKVGQWVTLGRLA